MPLSEDQVQQYRRDGFLPMHDVLTPLEVKALHLRLEDIANEVIDFPKNLVQIEPAVQSGEVPADPVRFNNVRKFTSLTKHDPLFHAYARHPKILDVVTRLIGPNVKISLDQTLANPPLVGSARPPCCAPSTRGPRARRCWRSSSTRRTPAPPRTRSSRSATR